jgi:diguanylate cyclase (GGDEF)-like protein
VRDAVLDTIEQGVIVWGPDDTCVFFNGRVHSLLELDASELAIGTDRAMFGARSRARGEISSRSAEEITAFSDRGEAFTFERTLLSGRVVAIAARPLPDGGHVVSYTDVTAARKLMTELEASRKAAEAAESRIKGVLAFEERRRRQLHMLSMLGEWLQSCKTLQELYGVVSAHMTRLLPGGAGELYIYSNSRDMLDGACSWHDTTVLDHIHPDDCWSLRRGRSYVFGTGEVDFICGHVADQGWEARGKGYFCIPIVAHGDTVGLLHVKVPHDHTMRPNDDFETLAEMRMFAIQCAEQISLAVANVKLRDQLRDQSIRDALTGLYNRRYLLEELRREIARALKKGTPLSLISFDADHFKRFNDNHGHDAGDTVLRALGELMRKRFDGDEVGCRLGGEEFVIMLPETDREAACVQAEGLRAAVEGLVIRYGDHNLPRVTISLGVATAPGDGSEPQSLLAAADSALYRAKSAGRNRVCA